MPQDHDYADRFRAYVNVVHDDTSCWVYMGGLNSGGYGIFKIAGQSVTAHRVAYILEHSSIPAGMHVLHRCRNRACVRPSHLYAGTHTQNMQDRRVDRGGSYGGGQPRSLSLAQELALWTLYRDGYTQRELASMYGISEATTSRILHDPTRKLIPDA